MASSSRKRARHQAENTEINVGGTIFVTTRTSLCSQPGSMLARMFAVDSPFEQYIHDEEGRMYIDRDPVSFGSILAFLRTGRFAQPPMRVAQVVDGTGDSRRVIDTRQVDAAALRVLAVEADYFGLDSLLASIHELLYGFTASELKQAGFDVRTLKDMGFCAHSLYSANFRPAQLWEHCVPCPKTVPTDTLVIARGGIAGHLGKFAITSQNQSRIKLTTSIFDEKVPTHAHDEFDEGVRLVRFESDAWSSTDLYGKKKHL